MNNEIKNKIEELIKDAKKNQIGIHYVLVK